MASRARAGLQLRSTDHTESPPPQVRADLAPLLALQQLAGNRATAAYLAASRTDQRDAAHPALARAQAHRPPVQRQKKKGRSKAGGMKIIGQLHVYDNLTGERVKVDWNFALPRDFLEQQKRAGNPVRSGSYRATVTVSGETVSLKWAKHDLVLTMITNRKAFVADVTGDKKLVLVLDVPGGTVLKEGYQAGKLPPDAQLDEGAEGGGGKAGSAEAGGGGKGRKEGATGTKPKSEETTPSTGSKEPGGVKGGTGVGDRPGSKYGWLGWLELDADTIKMLEAIFEAMGDSQEFIALQQTLQALQELGQHADQLPRLLSPEVLVKVVLGLPNDADDAVTAIETWVNRETAANPKATHPSRKGIAALAAKLLGLVRRLRAALKPVFTARSGFQTVFGTLQSVLVEVDSFPLLLQHLQGRPLPADDLRRLLDKLGKEAAASFVAELQAFKGEIEILAVRFTKSDLLDRDDIARAIVAGATLATPKQYKPVVWVLRTSGFDRLLADNVIDKLIPSEAVESVNNSLLRISAPLARATGGLRKDLDAVFTATQKLAADSIPTAIKAILPAAAVQRADTNAGSLSDHLAEVSGKAVSGVLAAMPKKGAAGSAKAVARVEQWLAANEQRQVLSRDDPRLPAQYYRYFPDSPTKKPRAIRRTVAGIVAGVSPLMIYKGRLWRKGRILAERRDTLGQVVVRSELGPPSGRKDYEQLLPRGVEVLLPGKWERAHSQGQGTGVESREGIRLAPWEVNQRLQRIYVEGRIAEIVREKAPGVKVLLTTETSTWPGTLRLKRIEYTLELARAGERARTIFGAWIEVSDSKKAPRISYDVDPAGGWNDIDRYLAPASSTGQRPGGRGGKPRSKRR